MPVRLLPQLRLFNPSLPALFPSMKLGPSISSSQATLMFSRIFPFKLKYVGLASSCLMPNEQPGVRRFSARSFRARTGSGSEFKRGRDRGEARVSKSLIEDEAELSDWVGELRSDSFRGRLTSDDESEGDRDYKSRNRGRGRESYSTKRRRRESDSDEFSELNRQRAQAPIGSFSKDSRMNRRFDSDDEDFSSQRRSHGSRGENMNLKANSSSGKRSGKNVEMGLGYNRNRDSRNLREGGKDSRKGLRFMDDEDEEGVEGSKFGIKDLISEEDSDSFEDTDNDEDGTVAKKTATSLFGLDEEVGTKDSQRSSPNKSDSYLSYTRFDQCSVSPLSLKGIKDAGYEKMTVVQEATLPVILQGKDVLAKAKTGTGKTVAFLLPSIEVVVKSPPVARDQKRPPIIVLVICPTRELASQAAAEANTLLKYHPSIGVQVVIGGTRLALEQKRMQANPCQILVATPGRLRDHIENTAGFATRLMGVKVLVLDEADHLLDMGFRKDIEKIIAAVPKQRQTLLFSATVPEQVRQICHVALKRDHEFINTVEEGSEETHSQVRQMHLVAPLEMQFPLLYVLLKEHIADDVDYKVLVFCTTAMVTRMVADLLGELSLNVREIHSRKPQSYRTRISDEFRKSKGLILVTSDVSARGVDYPDVTLVIQVGLPADREQYIHRLGRTGRKGKEGHGVLLLAPWEEFFLSTIKDLPISKAPVPSVDPDTKRKVERALSHVEMKNKEAAYQAWLGYYNSYKSVGRDKHRLVELANDFSRSMGLNNPPAIPKLVLGKMGLRNVPGLRSK
ncbi:DEAD-box ATP-dependent RNA helicase 31 [Ziziphus jujuba]|uniref:ATP-dependent RNA helicase n=1 Tax=Ziziphus jujuba TaxID=326968 RepID=A0A6P4A1H7_ZIZJJ|nr:DEAD-box ATP-dependent RNA helicase 31 [Ziziphus jujuba]